MNLAGGLAEGIAALGVTIPARSHDRMLAYLALLEKWNRTYNLTAVREQKAMLTHHVLDSLAVVPHLRGDTWVDVGSGAGLPGIPLALACPESAVALVERSQKKAAFLRQAVLELAIPNVGVVCSRVEEWRPRQEYDIVISRAFSSLAEFLARAAHLCSPLGLLAAMKGAYPSEELSHLPPRYQLHRVVRLSVPGLQAERHLVLIRPE